jgi:hypothetical protein
MNSSDLIRREQKKVQPALDRAIQEGAENLLSNRFLGPVLPDGGAAYRTEVAVQIGKATELVGSLSPEAKREVLQGLGERLAKDEKVGGYEVAQHEATVIRGILGIEGR